MLAEAFRGLDVLFPRSCCACGTTLNRADEQGLCWDCRTDTHSLGPPWCDRCGIRVAGRIDHAFTCVDCEENPPAFHHARSLFAYEGGIREAIHAFKYNRDFSVVPDLARLLVAGMEAHYPEGPVDLVPVPLHPGRERHRGFNQGRELIRVMRRLRPGLRVWTGLRRIRNTDTQTRLSKAARRKNVQGAFRFVSSSGPVPSRVILLDDVMTTGATLDACSRTLIRGGVKEVDTLTLARG